MRTASRGIRCVVAAIALLIASGAASAQTYTGGMRGVVKDAQGIVPGVEVTLVNDATNAARSVVTNEVGEYSFPGVLPGTYTVRVALAGFRTEERRGLPIATQQMITMDFTLEVGALEEQITVRATAPVVERSTASVATTMTAAQITAIPLFGRNTFYTAIATPGVINSGDPQFVRYQDQSGASLLSLGGGPRRGNAYMIEGVSITDMLNRASWVPSTEGVEDMKVQLKTYDAEMGRAAGGVFNVTAKSGSNSWHGSTLFMNKPGWGTGKLFFAKIAGTPNPPQYLLLVGGLGRRPGREGQDVLLVQQGRLHAEEHAEQRAHVPDRPRACRRLLAVRRHHLRPADHPAEPERHRLHPRPVPGQRHSRQSPQPDRAEHAHADADADLGPLVQQSGQPRRRTAGSGNGEDRSALGLEVDDHRHVCPPAHG